MSSDDDRRRKLRKWRPARAVLVAQRHVRPARGLCEVCELSIGPSLWLILTTTAMSMRNGTLCMSLLHFIYLEPIWFLILSDIILIERFCSTVRIPFASPKHASIAKQAIEVDRELQPQVVKRTLVVENDELVAFVHSSPRIYAHLLIIISNRTYSCLTVRLTRLSVNSFLENVELVIRTIGEFGEDADSKRGTAS